MANRTYTDQEAAAALVSVLGSSKWNAVAYSHGYLAMEHGLSKEESSRMIYDHGPQTLKDSKHFIEQASSEGLLAFFTERTRTGSAANPITKLFPATITEERFLQSLDELSGTRATLTYTDERESGTLVDFVISEGDLELPINIKNAGTRFEKARALVGLEPDDCIPIPAYKAHGALEVIPNLLYVISVDYRLISTLNDLLPKLLNAEELIVWDLLNKYAGSKVKDAEDSFVFGMVKKYWERIKETIGETSFNVISARKAIRILQTKPQRTPGIGLKAWGTGANAEVNVHISISEETTHWDIVRERIAANGINDILQAVNRKRTEVVYDPEI